MRYRVTLWCLVSPLRISAVLCGKRIQRQFTAEGAEEHRGYAEKILELGERP